MPVPFPSPLSLSFFPLLPFRLGSRCSLQYWCLPNPFTAKQAPTRANLHFRPCLCMLKNEERLRSAHKEPARIKSCHISQPSYLRCTIPCMLIPERIRPLYHSLSPSREFSSHLEWHPSGWGLPRQGKRTTATMLPRKKKSTDGSIFL